MWVSGFIEAEEAISPEVLGDGLLACIHLDEWGRLTSKSLALKWSGTEDTAPKEGGCRYEYTSLLDIGMVSHAGQSSSSGLREEDIAVLLGTKVRYSAARSPTNRARRIPDLGSPSGHSGPPGPVIRWDKR